MTVRKILAELAHMPEADILDTMTIRYDLGLTGSALAPRLLAEFGHVDTILLYDPAALVHDVELAVH